MKRGHLLIIVVIALAGPVLPACSAGNQTLLRDQKAKDSYSLGYEFGGNLRRQEIDLDADVMLAAAREALDGKKPALSPEEIRDTLLLLRQKTMVMQDKRFRERAARNREEGTAYLAANGTKDGVTTLPSGLQYRVLKEGDGPRPNVTDTVTVHYRGTLVNGSEFDNSYSRGKPSTFPVNGMTPGWEEALQLMKAGSKWQVFIPAELAYGERQFGRIPPNSVLIFEIELISVEEGIVSSDLLRQEPEEDTGKGPEK